MIREFTVTEEYDNRKLFVFLRGGCSLSSSFIRSVKYLENGLKVNGERAKTDRIVKTGDTVAVNDCQDEGFAEAGGVRAVFQSDCAVVFDKPAGMATHPTLNHRDGTLADSYNGTFRPVNRLDKNTSGLVLAAKNRYATPLLAKSVKKRYIAVAEGEITEEGGTIDAPIERDEGIVKRRIGENGKPSVTKFEVLKRAGGYSVLRVETLTGRTHQIRVHMAHIGHPLAGDTLYGGSDKLISRHALHCFEMRFTDPTDGKEVELTSELPEDIRRLISGGTPGLYRAGTPTVRLSML